MVKNIIFDFDGIIADTNKIKIKVLTNILSQHFEYPKNNISNLLVKSLPGLNRLAYIEILQKIKNQKVDKKKILASINTEILKLILHSKINTYLKKMRGHDKKINWYIITSGNEREVIFFLKKNKINNYFKDVVGGKGDKYLSFLSLSKKYKINRENLVVIGDGNGDLKLIKRLSCYGILVLKWSLEKNYLKNLKVPKIQILNNFRELNIIYKNIIRN
tara:strand:- start:62 stop:715 length:654 start_codon:yes stop_codon:yes gene_type:complete